MLMFIFKIFDQNFFLTGTMAGLRQPEPFYINAQKSSRIQYKFLEDREGEDLADQEGS
jgi:hypothetical protein